MDKNETPEGKPPPPPFSAARLNALVLPTKPGTQAPEVQLNRIEKIPTLEVIKTDLVELKEASGETNVLLGFTTTLAGIFLATLLGLLVLPASASLAVLVTYITITISAGFLSLLCLVLWLGRGRKRDRIFERIMQAEQSKQNKELEQRAALAKWRW